MTTLSHPQTPDPYIAPTIEQFHAHQLPASSPPEKTSGVSRSERTMSARHSDNRSVFETSSPQASPTVHSQSHSQSPAIFGGHPLPFINCHDPETYQLCVAFANQFNSHLPCRICFSRNPQSEETPSFDEHTGWLVDLRFMGFSSTKATHDGRSVPAWEFSILFRDPICFVECNDEEGNLVRKADKVKMEDRKWKHFTLSAFVHTCYWNWDELGWVYKENVYTRNPYDQMAMVEMDAALDQPFPFRTSKYLDEVFPVEIRKTVNKDFLKRWMQNASNFPVRNNAFCVDIEQVRHNSDSEPVLYRRKLQGKGQEPTKKIGKINVKRIPYSQLPPHVIVKPRKRRTRKCEMQQKKKLKDGEMQQTISSDLLSDLPSSAPSPSALPTPTTLPTPTIAPHGDTEMVPIKRKRGRPRKIVDPTQVPPPPPVKRVLKRHRGPIATVSKKVPSKNKSGTIVDRHDDANDRIIIGKNDTLPLSYFFNNNNTLAGLPHHSLSSSSPSQSNQTPYLPPPLPLAPKMFLNDDMSIQNPAYGTQHMSFFSSSNMPNVPATPISSQLGHTDFGFLNQLIGSSVTQNAPPTQPVQSSPFIINRRGDSLMFFPIVDMNSQSQIQNMSI